MEKAIAVFTIFTFLLFAGTTARISLDTFTSKPSTESVVVADSNDVLSIQKPQSELDQTIGNDRFPDSENTQTLDVSRIELMPRLRFARPHPIKRHFFDKTSRIPLRFVRRHPCRKFQKTYMLPRKMSYGNDMIVSGKTYSLDPKTLGDQVPTEWLEFRHSYGHRHHHHHHDGDEEFVPKFMFNGEKMLSSSHHHKEKREHKSGFMRRIRKFLKHTFD